MKNLKDFEAPAPQIEKLSELIFLSSIILGSAGEIVTMIGNAKNGKQIGGVGEIGLIGRLSAGCNETFEKLNLQGVEKKWDLAEWVVPLEFCYEDIKGKLEGLSLKTGIAIEDMTSDEYMTDLVMPLLQKAINKMLWRFIWFNDTAAKNVAEGGVITDGVDLKYFNLNDGLFKRIFAIMAAKPGQYVAIEANSKATIAEQRKTLYTIGTATGIMDSMIAAKSPRMGAKENVSFKMTEAFAEALRWDLKKSNSGDLVFTETKDGVKLAKYGGYDVIVLPIWDQMIGEYENLGATYNKPYRVILCAKGDLLAGTGSQNSLEEFRTGFDEKAGTNWYKAKDTIGTQTLEDDLIVAAY